jgi:hypothetical protein
MPLSVASGFQESGMSTEIAGLSSGTFTVPAGEKLVSRKEKARAVKTPLNQREIERNIMCFS